MKNRKGKEVENWIDVDPIDVTGKDLTSQIVDTSISTEPQISAQADNILADEMAEENETETVTAPATPMSTPSVATYEQASNGDGERERILSEVFDKSGTRFDPVLHCEKDGVPTVNSDGNFRKRKKGANVVAQVGTVDQPYLKCHVAAVQTVKLLVHAGMILGGDIWQPKKDDVIDEEAMLISAFRDYYIATGFITIPPWLGLSMALGMYAAPRLTHPNTIMRVQGFVSWIKSKKSASNRSTIS